MISVTWRKKILVLQNRLYLYPPPEPKPHTRLFWLAMGLVALMAVLFSGFFILFLTGQHDAYLTHAEDLGIMDQALWSLLHGQLFHQTICNVLTDTNCYSPSGISRFAIHFEPILFLVSLFYAIVPNPKTLQVLQTLVVASGAFPAFWLARLRLRNELAGVAIALLYLFYPALQWATIFDFHPVTLTAALLLFTLYFMYTRRTLWLFVFAILAMACKEEIPAVVALFAVWSIIFQRRWRSGLALLAVALVWIGVEFLVIHIFSPTGQHLLAGRWSYLGSNPIKIALHLLAHPTSTIKQFVLEPHHLLYIRSLFSPTGYIALFTPWVLVLAAPSLLLNLLSSDPQMYSGLFQYDAEMVPILIFATIEALVLLLWLLQLIVARLSTTQEPSALLVSAAFPFRASRPRWLAYYGILFAMLAYVTFSVIRIDYYRGTMPFSQGFTWPVTTQHNALAQHFIDMIPATASVSAQSSLAPHVSHRTKVYLFPYADSIADYVFLDVSSDIYPYVSTYEYVLEAKNLILNKHYGIAAAQDGYLLLKRGLPSPGVSPASLVQPDGTNVFYVVPNLPTAFCSYIDAPAKEVTNPVQVSFITPDKDDDDMDLIGYDVDAPNPFSISAASLTITTYWRLDGPVTVPLQILGIIVGKDGQQHLATTDFPAVVWCQTHTWKSGTVMRITCRLFNIQASGLPTGLAHVSIALAPLLQPFSTITDERFRLPVHVVKAPQAVTTTQGSNAVQLMPLTLVP